VRAIRIVFSSPDIDNMFKIRKRGTQYKKHTRGGNENFVLFNILSGYTINSLENLDLSDRLFHLS
jgi:hypothetical protein